MQRTHPHVDKSCWVLSINHRNAKRPMNKNEARANRAPSELRVLFHSDGTQRTVAVRLLLATLSLNNCTGFLKHCTGLLKNWPQHSTAPTRALDGLKWSTRSVTDTQKLFHHGTADPKATAVARLALGVQTFCSYFLFCVFLVYFFSFLILRVWFLLFVSSSYFLLSFGVFC